MAAVKPRTTRTASASQPKRAARNTSSVRPTELIEGEDDTSTTDAVVRDIMAGLFDGHYVPGQRLVEPDLMLRYNVGRSTIREALKCLASDGIVKLERHKGAYIHNPGPHEVDEILRVMEVMMGLAARLAAENIGDSGAAARLKQSYSRALTVAKNNNLGHALPIRNAFHQTIFEIGQNHQVLRLMPTMHVQLVRVTAAPITGAETRARYYQNLAEAILAGDGDRAERVARTHVRSVRKRIHQPSTGRTR